MALMVKPKLKIALFDRSVIRRDWNSIKRDPLTRGGMLVRKIARQSIRRVSTDRPSQPGRPPRAHSKAKGAAFKLIYSVPDRSGANLNVIVGMIGFRDSEDAVPGLMEYGGTVTRRVSTRGRRGRRSRQRLAGTETVRYPARPFMLPALEKARTKLPEMWRNSIR